MNECLSIKGKSIYKEIAQLVEHEPEKLRVVVQIPPLAKKNTWAEW
jgi:hypothetical protein